MISDGSRPVSAGFSARAQAFTRPLRASEHLTTMIWGMGLIATVLTGIAVVVHNPKPAHIEGFALTIGLIAIWRYSWWMAHALRAVFFLKFRFPAMRRKADSADGGLVYKHIYAIVLSYRIEPREFFLVYESLIRNALDCGRPMTIFASITSLEDEALLEQVYDACGRPPQIEIISQFQDGTGKRSAIGMALRSLTRRVPEGDLPVLLMDGDIVAEDGALRKSLEIMQAYPELGAVTTNNDAFVDGSYLTRNWYILRYAQRHMLMASMSLSRRLLVLTGRFSIFRADIATDPEFLDLVERDAIHHWRLGEIRFVSGDDKSTWYHMMKNSRQMLYIPDVKVFGFEALPAGSGFVSGATSLMRRWFGNMLRSNGRAVALGPRKTGLFVFWSLLDQRISIWTAMIGPIAALMFAGLLSPIYLVFYLLWVLMTRILMASLAGSLYGKFSPVWPFLLYFNQIWGAFLKSYLWFRPNRQGWTRQKIGSAKSGAVIEVWSNRFLHLASLGVFVRAVGILTDLVSLPKMYDFEVFIAGAFSGP